MTQPRPPPGAAVVGVRVGMARSLRVVMIGVPVPVTIRCVMITGSMAVTRLVDRYVAVVINWRMSMAVRVLLVACHMAYRGTPIRLRLQRSYAQ